MNFCAIAMDSLVRASSLHLHIVFMHVHIFGTNQSEKDARPNLTLRGFEAIDDIKSQIERAYPGIVSCADILELAAPDAFSFPIPMWDVLTGRRDGMVSLISD
ncbi:peroxidase 24-like, partial [Olea europaea var. sylvestris]|uniref:peroxidase 24-like n=1 Tax=Olea europaea var. sylvestris TaxID=158386 RepID=UPI000C1D4F43